MPAIQERASVIAAIRPGDLRIRAASQPKVHSLSAVDALAKMHGIRADTHWQMKTFSGPTKAIFTGTTAAD